MKKFLNSQLSAKCWSAKKWIDIQFYCWEWNYKNKNKRYSPIQSEITKIRINGTHQKYSCMLERKCVKSCRSLQHRNGVTRFKQVENQSRNHGLRKRTCCHCMLRTEIRHSVSTGCSIPLLHTLVWCGQFLW